MRLTPDLASLFARTALGHVTREYPNKLDHVMAGDADARTPRALHPAFYGSFDWHSCVHSWWMLLRAAREYPALAEGDAILSLAGDTFTPAKIAAELAYAKRPQSSGFERPYGWAWLLYLHLEAGETDERWAAALEPLARHFAAGFAEYLGKLQYPITTGTHYNTAFALTLALPWAEKFDTRLHTQIEVWATDHFGKVHAYAGWEPGGDEFLSPVLSAALLMSRILPAEQFAPWFAQLLPQGGWLETHCHPVSPTDTSDGKMAHLDGVNMSRGWALHALAGVLGDSPRAAAMRARADSHIAASIDAVDGHYMSSHWLASFALLALLEARRTS